MKASAPRVGSTLIELLVVLVVLGVLLAVVNLASMNSGAPVPPRDRLRMNAVVGRDALTAVDSSNDPRVLRRAEPTGFNLADSAGTVIIGARR